MDFFMFAEALIFFLVGASKEEYMFPHLWVLVAGLPPAGLPPLLKDTPWITCFCSQQRDIIFPFKQESSAEHWDKIWKTMNICAIKNIAFVYVKKNKITPCWELKSAFR